jgi:hypothetical protein
MPERRRIVDEALDVSAHQPSRPGWVCEADGADWPCEPYRDWVIATFPASTDRAIHMAGFWQFAIVELPKPEVAGDIHRRFLGWTKEHVEAGPVRGRPPGGIF